MRTLLTIIWEPGAARELDDLPLPYRVQVESDVYDLALAGRGDVGPYRRTPGVYRLRSGRYRVLFERDGDALVIMRVERRDKVYRH